MAEAETSWDFPDDLLEAAWGIIANAWDWNMDDRQDWRAAAKRWRDAYHETLNKVEGG